MTTLLRLNSSILGADSVSRQLSDELLAGLRRRHGDLEIIERDFAAEPIPHLDGEWLGALFTPEADRSDEQQSKADYSDTLIRELQAAGLILIGLPMYNFSVPSMLKAWFDHVARAGVTFRYTDRGAEGLLRGRKAYLVTAMGGQHESGRSDFLRPYVTHMLGFLGITDVSVVTADGLSMGEAPRAQGLARARKEIRRLSEQGASTREEAA